MPLHIEMHVKIRDNYIRATALAIRVVLTVALSCTAFAAGAQTLSFEDAAVSQLRCETAPIPGPFLAALRDAERIDPNKNTGYDSLSCFHIKGGVSIRGMRFDSICAFEEDANERNKYPGLFYRGPGTSPGQTLSFGSPAPMAELRAWARREIEGVGADRGISERILFDASGQTLAGSEIECSSWIAK